MSRVVTFASYPAERFLEGVAVPYISRSPTKVM